MSVIVWWEKYYKLMRIENLPATGRRWWEHSGEMAVMVETILMMEEWIKKMGYQ